MQCALIFPFGYKYFSEIKRIHTRKRESISASKVFSQNIFLCQMLRKFVKNVILCSIFFVKYNF